MLLNWINYNCPELAVIMRKTGLCNSFTSFIFAMTYNDFPRNDWFSWTVFPNHVICMTTVYLVYSKSFMTNVLFSLHLSFSSCSLLSAVKGFPTLFAQVSWSYRGRPMGMLQADMHSSHELRMMKERHAYKTDICEMSVQILQLIYNCDILQSISSHKLFFIRKYVIIYPHCHRKYCTDCIVRELQRWCITNRILSDISRSGA